ncbi:glycoside hydrolase family 97 protein [Rhodohalobacter sp. 8-1]|uniref:glycoside hydrolase family 97 protein n=1 Tax=Rhodohalobacter sp. 8-1 TaxID=3131972 RepID=UPI0030ED767E
MAPLNYLFLILLAFNPFQAADTSHTVSSPAGNHTITFELADGRPYYSVIRNTETVIDRSALGFELENETDLAGPFEIEYTESTTFDNTWTQVWGEKREIRNHYNELKVGLKEPGGENRELIIVFRSFDDGIGFRYEFPAQDNLKAFNIMDELTEFNLTGNHMAWWIGAYQWNRFEYLTNETPLSEADTVHTPLTMKTDDGLYLSIHEAALVDYSTMTLERTEGNRLKANLMPWYDGIRVRTEAPSVTPWRTIQIAENPGDLITSYLILNLNEPNKLEDTSWIEPGKYVGIWWEMHLDKSTWGPGPRHGATTENTKRYIDFAAEHGFDHVLVEGWNKGWDENWYESGAVFSFTEPMDDFDLDYLANYALEKGVRLMGHHETSATIEHYESQVEDGFELYNDLGVRAVKTGYVGHGQEIFWTNEEGNKHYEWHHGQHMVNHHQDIVELAADYKIMLNVHEGVKDTGLRRTWPNLMTREVARGQEYNAWGENQGNPLDHVLYIPFTRLLAGPFDYTPGIVDLTFEEYRPDNRVNHTLAKELALYVVIYSPLQMAADLPENYEERPEPFQFIKDVPADWDDTRVLNAEIGNFITIVRKDRNSDDWYLGSLTNEEARSFEINLDFLDNGKQYVAEIYRDSADADWESNPYGFVTEEKEIATGDNLVLELAPGGGQAIRFRVVEN